MMKNQHKWKDDRDNIKKGMIYFIMAFIPFDQGQVFWV